MGDFNFGYNKGISLYCRLGQTCDQINCESNSSTRQEVCELMVEIVKKQECIPVGCVPPTAVAIQGVSTRHPPTTGTPPRTRHPWTRHPPGSRHPPGPGTPRTRHLPGPGTPRGQTHACKHITLPQTSFAGGNDTFRKGCVAFPSHQPICFEDVCCDCF